jgi:hypothetical protein
VSVSVIDNSFLNTDDCQYLKEKIMYLQPYWQHTDNIGSFNFLPLGMYTCSRSRYVESVTQYRQLMLDNFEFVYVKLIDKLQSLLNIEIIENKQLHLPGFHISTTKGMHDTNFHRDKFMYLKTFTNGHGSHQNVSFKHKLREPDILSIIIPIALPKCGAGLLYYEESVLKELTYANGIIASWPGSIVHSIKPYTIENEFDLRITMQCHLVKISENKAYLFW